MRYVGMALAVVLVALVVVSPAAAQSKWVRGTVVSTAADSFTVKVGDTDMAFKVTPETELVARGAGSAMRAAQKAGASGVKYTDFVKQGEGVEVHYKMDGQTMVATEIRAGVTIPAKPAPAAEKGSSVMGTVTEITGDSVTIKAEGKDWKFMVTPKTMVFGKGMGTKTAELKAQGKAGPSVKDLLVVNDIVSVKYVENAGAMTATDITMITPSLTRK